MNSRRSFLKNITLAGAGIAFLPSMELMAGAKKKWFDISLAQWSLNRTIRKGELNNMGFPQFAKEKFGIEAVEYVNSFFDNNGSNKTYLNELATRSKDLGVRNVMIMVDGEGQLGDSSEDNRVKSVENHYKWIDAAQMLGCMSIRVNAAGQGSREQLHDQVVKSLTTLAEYGMERKINVIVENHGGLSSHGDWLVAVLKDVGKKNCGSLPDFGNFYEYDRYQGVKELMQFAKGVSAKSYDFDASGTESKIDYAKMMKIVKDSGFRGYVGIEYEGDRLSEIDGIKATKKLLEKIR